MHFSKRRMHQHQPSQAGTLLPTNTAFKSLCICLKYRQKLGLRTCGRKSKLFFEIDFKFNVKSFKMKKIGSQKIYFSFYWRAVTPLKGCCHNSYRNEHLYFIPSNYNSYHLSYISYKFWRHMEWKTIVDMIGNTHDIKYDTFPHLSQDWKAWKLPRIRPEKSNFSWYLDDDTNCMKRPR